MGKQKNNILKINTTHLKSKNSYKVNKRNIMIKKNY
jgi:hypothetical protein